MSFSALPSVDSWTSPTADINETPKLISVTTVASLSSILVIAFASYAAAKASLPRNSSTRIQLLFIWHIFDALIHFTLEASFLYHCFFSWAPTPALQNLASSPYFPFPVTPYGVSFKGDPDHLYGSFYSDAPMAKLWQEYARADRRWGGSDLTIISLELLTVFVMAPMSIYICYLLHRGDPKAWIYMVIVATGELYGGFMTFAPEWLSGNPNLDGSNWMFLWLYLVFFNAGLWVLIPIWVLWESFGAISEAFGVSKGKLQRAIAPTPSKSVSKSKKR